MKELTNNQLEEFRKFLESPEGQKSIQDYADKLDFEYKLRKNNLSRVKKMFNNKKTFNVLINRIISKHDQKYIEKCYSKGLEPYPNNLLYAMFDLSEEKGKQVEPFDDLTKNSSSEIYSYNGWQFAITYGQGAVCSVYHKKELMCRL